MTIPSDTRSTRPTIPETSEPSNDKALPKLTLNPDRYREHLSEFELTQDQQNDMMHILWNIMNTFVGYWLGCRYGADVFTGPLLKSWPGFRQFD